MTSTTQPPSELPDSDELVAYLDGELAPEECRRIEQRLSTDATYRQQLRELDQAWEALGELPHTTIGDEFVKTTMDLVTLEAEREVATRTAALPAVRRKRTFLLLAAGIVAASLGYAAERVLTSSSNDTLIADLPVITEVDLLTQVEDIDFLHGLKELQLEQFVDDEPSLQHDIDALQSAASPSEDERRSWIESLPADQKASLAAQWKRLQNLSPAPEAQERMRVLQREIAQAADADELQHTLLVYGQWLSRRTPGEQAELRSLPTDQRLERVKQFARQDNRQAARQLSAEDAKVLREAVLAMAEQRKQAILEQLRQGGAANPEQRLEGRRAAGALFLLFRGLQDEATRDELRERLTSGLSPMAQEHLESLHSPWRERQLWQWVRDSLQPKLGPEELERFFAEDLDNNQRERLLSLPREEMEAELERLYFGAGAQLGLRDIQGLRGFGDPGRFGPGPRRPDMPGEGPPRGPRWRPWDAEPRPHDPGHRGPPPQDGFDRDRFPPGGPPPPNGPPGRPWDNQPLPPDQQPPPEEPHP
jgi:hypothetical protein